MLGVTKTPPFKYPTTIIKQQTDGAAFNANPLSIYGEKTMTRKKLLRTLTPPRKNRRAIMTSRHIVVQSEVVPLLL